jgi:AcrR family transcriptional regulator
VSSTPIRSGAQRKRRARGSISAEEILVGAYELASQENLDALSMPRLAQRLDVGVTSIYWYFRSKEDLLDTMTERAMAEFDRGFDIPEGLPWEEYVRTYFRQFREVFRTNGLLCDLIVMRSPNFTPEATRIAAERITTVLRVLVAAGFDPDTAMYAYSSLSVYTRGAVALERSWMASNRPPLATTSALSEVSDSQVLAAMRAPHALSMTSNDDFEFGLDNGIRGLRALLDDLLADEPCVRKSRSGAGTEQVARTPATVSPR